VNSKLNGTEYAHFLDGADYVKWCTLSSDTSWGYLARGTVVSTGLVLLYKRGSEKCMMRDRDGTSRANCTVLTATFSFLLCFVQLL
jgi:hypothetical protein